MNKMFFIVISVVLLGTDLIYHQVNGSPDMNVNERVINEAMNKSINEQINQANKIIAAANASNITDANINQFDDELDDNSGVGYYDPPYSYTQCLTVFTKEMCDFRFNSD